MLSNRTLNKEEFLRYGIRHDALYLPEFCPIVISQDQPFHLTNFGIPFEKKTIYVNRYNVSLQDGGIYLFQTDNGTSLARLTDTLTGNYTIETDLVKSVISKEARKIYISRSLAEG